MRPAQPRPAQPRAAQPRARLARAAALALWLGAGGAAGAGGAGFAQVPSRFADVHPVPVPGQIVEHRFGVLGDHVYFAGTAPQTGVELYQADVRSGSSRLLVDLEPGPGSSFPFGFTVVGARLFFFCAGSGRGFELWVTDGTTTVLVRDIASGPASAVVPDDAVRPEAGVLGGALLFAADDGAGRGLWRSDGTTAGTTLVARFGPAASTAPRMLRQFAAVAGFGLFLSDAATTGACELWQTDGTAAGTRLLRTLPAPQRAVLRVPYKLHAAGSGAFLTGDGWLWHVVPGPATKIDTLLANSGMVHSRFGNVVDPLTLQRRFLFSGGTELWRSDGTAAGTVPYFPQGGLGVLTDHEQDPSAQRDRLLFFGFDLQHGEEPWITDGTPQGTRLLRDLRAGPPDSARRTRFADGARVASDGVRFFFAADDGVNGLELFVSDGTAGGTKLVGDVHAGAGDATPRSLQALPNGGVAFVAEDRAGTQLFAYDAATARVRRLATNFLAAAPRTRAARIAGLTAHEDRLLFAGNDGRAGTEPWFSDGTAAGTRLLRDLHPGAGSSLRHHDPVQGPDHAPLRGVALGVDFYFNGYAGPGKLALFRTDGTTAGTVKVRDLDRPGGLGWDLIGAGLDAATLVFQGYEQAQGSGVFALRAGATAMTRLSATQPGLFFRLGSRLLYTDGLPPSPGGLWVTDGTPAGTAPLLAWPPFTGEPFLMAGRGREAFFTVPARGGELWRTDGSPGGTRLVRGVAVVGLATVHGELFLLEESAAGMALRRGDGTAAGTTTVVGGLPRTSRELVVAGGRLFFLAFPAGDAELWTSDGGAGGTVRLRRFVAAAGGVPSLRGALAVGSRRLLFQVRGTPGFGTELWQSDGTAAGTRVFDVFRGPEGDNGGDLALVQGRVFFHADDGRDGSVDGDLWVLDPGAVAYAGIDGCAAGGFAPELRGTDPVLGGATTWVLRGTPQRGGVLLLGVGLPQPLRLPWGCRIHPDPGAAVALAIATGAGGEWTLGPVAVPNLPSLRGVRMALQAAVASAPGMPLGADLSNSLVLSFGD